MSLFVKPPAEGLLAVDGVLTPAQIKRWAGDLSGLPRPIVVEGRSGPLAYYVHEAFRDVPPQLLLHLAGVGEMRRVLGARPEDWTLSPKRAEIDYKGTEPDALWRRPDGLVAIEFDAGDYSRARVRKKLRSYAKHYAAQIWGVLSVSRRQFVRSLAGSVSGVEILLVQL